MFLPHMGQLSANPALEGDTLRDQVRLPYRQYGGVRQSSADVGGGPAFVEGADCHVLDIQWRHA